MAVILCLLGLALAYWLSRAPAKTHHVLPDGMRLATQAFELVINQDAETITVRAADAVHKTPGNPQGGDRRPIDLTFPAAGFQVQLTRETRPVHANNRRKAERTPDVYTRSVLQTKSEPAQTVSAPLEHTGMTTVVFLSRRHPLAEEGSQLALELDAVKVRNVPNAEADDFKTRFAEVGEWVKDMERALHARVQAHEQERQQAQLRASHALKTLSQDCAFVPEHEAMDFDAAGQVLWAIKLGSDGQCWIHADGRTYQGSLRGGKATPFNDSLEVMVRDAKWENSYFSRRKMKVLAGAAPATLVEWSQRINRLAATGASSPVLKPPQSR